MKLKRLEINFYKEKTLGNNITSMLKARDCFKRVLFNRSKL